jgi:glycosyltransferase involved in cell wall biosynthesis
MAEKPTTPDARSGPRGPLRVMIATPLGPGGKGGMDRIADLIVARIAARPDPSLSVGYLTTKGGLSKVRGAFVFTKALAELLTLSTRRQIDVLHINLAAFGSVYRKAILARAAAALNIPYVVHVHSGRFGAFWDQASPRVAALLARMLRDSAHIIVLGRGYRDLILQRQPDLADRITVLPNATSARPAYDRRAPPDGRWQITYLGYISQPKGVPDLVTALGRLSPRLDWTATIAGHGMIEETRQQAIALGIGDRVSLPGWVGPDQVDTLLQRTDIFVLPSYSEGLSMAVLEAFAAGAAVIATPVNAMTEVIDDGRNGLLVTPGDVDALSRALQRLLDDETLRVALARAGRADHAAHYEINGYVDRIIAIWRAAAAANAVR